jgi:hypothetical protein
LDLEGDLNKNPFKAIMGKGFFAVLKPLITPTYPADLGKKK